MKKVFLLVIFLIFIIELYFNIINIGKYLFEEKQYKIAVEIFKKIDYKEESQYYLLEAYLNGLGVNKDYTKAFQYAEKLASNNDYFGSYILGLMYNYGYGTEKNLYKALEYYKKSLSTGNYLGHVVNLQIAKIYEFENEIGINFNEAEKYYLESIKFGNYESYILLGNLYEFKIKDFDKAINNYLKALKYDLNEAYYFLAQIYLKKNDFRQSIVYYEKAIEKKVRDVNNCFLAYLYKDVDRVKSYDLALDEINKKNEGKELLECYNTIAFNYSNKEIYFPESNDESIKYYKLIDKYSDKNFYNAEKIADFYYLQKDFNNSKIWYQKAYEYKNDQLYKNKIEKIDKDIQNSNINENKLFPIIDDTIINSSNNKILETEKYYFISNHNKSIIIYSKATKNILKILRNYMNEDSQEISALAYDEDKELLYVMIDNIGLINIIDINSGNVVNVIKTKNDYANDNLVLSKDGKILIHYSKSGKLKLINTENKKFQEYNFSTINIGIDKIKIELENLDYLIYVKTLDNNLYTFSYNHKRRINKEKFNNQIIFDEINELSQSAKINFPKIQRIENISYSDKIIKINFPTKVYNFDLKNLKLESIPDITNKNIKNIDSNYKVKFFHNNGIMKIYNSSGKFISKISLLFKGCEYYKIIDNKYIIIFTKFLADQYIYDLNSKLLAKIKGVNDIPISSYYKNGYLFLVNKNNLISIFNLNNLEKLREKPILFDTKKFPESDKFLKQFKLKEIFGEKTSEYFGYIPSYKEFYNFALADTLQKVEYIYPLAFFYVKDEDDWIIYTPEGLFTYSGNGKDLLKYHQNQGLYKEAKIIENDKLFDKFYRPDLIKKILAGEKVEIPMDVKSVILNIMPPELKILVNKMLNTKDIELTYQVCDAGNGIADAKLVINGQAINPPQSRGFSIEQKDTQNDKCKVYKSVHTLYPGKSTIEFKAYDKDMNIANVSDKVEVTADYKIIEKSKNMSVDEIKKLETDNNNIILGKSNLYFLSLAVGNYEDKNYNLKYPVNDVESVKEKFVKNSKNTFENIFTYKLQDNEVTKDNIDKIFDEISKKLKINDTFILYIAGHGIVKDGKYQFIPYKIDEKISIDNIKQNLAKIANYTNKSLVMLDTCYSGALIENINDNATTNRLSHDNNSINYIVASSSSQVALEGYNNHGIFTYSVLDAFDKNQTLKVNVLSDHVTELVPKITQEKFHFEQRPQVKLNQNFILRGEN